MDARIFVSGETDVSNLTCCASSNQGSVRTIGIENAVLIFVTQNFVMLDQVNVIHAEPAKGFVQLIGSRSPRAAIDLGHKERLGTIAVAQGFAHPDLTCAIV